MEKQRSSKLARLIHLEVQAQMKRYAMARTREEFINHLVDVLGPALSHYYRYTLGIINDRRDQVEKWQRQQEEFLDQFSDRLLTPTKAKGLDVPRAVQQALKELMQKDEARRRTETAKFQRNYKLKTITPLPEDAHEAFLARVRDIVTTVFPP